MIALTIPLGLREIHATQALNFLKVFTEVFKSENDTLIRVGLFF